MKQEKIRVKRECSDCGGTGLYVGLVCHDGAAVVCRRCKGAGYLDVEIPKGETYTPFISRKTRENIKRVFLPVTWKHFYIGKHTENGRTIDYDQYGCTYEEWKKGANPKPIPEL